MDSFEINKIITAILLVVLVVFGVGKISDIVFNVKKPDILVFRFSDVLSLVFSRYAFAWCAHFNKLA